MPKKIKKLPFVAPQGRKTRSQSSTQQDDAKGPSQPQVPRAASQDIVKFGDDDLDLPNESPERGKFHISFDFSRELVSAYCNALKL